METDSMAGVYMEGIKPFQFSDGPRHLQGVGVDGGRNELALCAAPQERVTGDQAPGLRMEEAATVPRVTGGMNGDPVWKTRQQLIVFKMMVGNI